MGDAKGKDSFYITQNPVSGREGLYTTPKQGNGVEYIGVGGVKAKQRCWNNSQNANTLSNGSCG